MKNQTGKLFYLVGASGAGKDSIIEACKARLADPASCRFARRLITRPTSAQGEHHISLCIEEFSDRLKRGDFAMHWQANGYHYGISQEINHWLTSGFDVVVNGSRAYLETAMNIYGKHLVPVHIDVATSVLRERLEKRNRESKIEIEQRLERAIAYNAKMTMQAQRIENNGALDVAAKALLKLINASDTIA